jgi:uncharacterized protein (DUF302 family)
MSDPVVVRSRWSWLPFLFGAVLGVLVAGAGAWFTMPSLMLTVHESRFATVDETCAALRASIEANGWFCPAVRDMNRSMAKQGVQMDEPIRIVELCNATHARAVLQTDPHVSTLMPCAWGVYERGGKVWIAGMNMSLMGRMFGGNIATVMADRVAPDERRILEPVIVGG